MNLWGQGRESDSDFLMFVFVMKLFSIFVGEVFCVAGGRKSIDHSFCISPISEEHGIRSTVSKKRVVMMDIICCGELLTGFDGNASLDTKLLNFSKTEWLWATRMHSTIPNSACIVASGDVALAQIKMLLIDRQCGGRLFDYNV